MGTKKDQKPKVSFSHLLLLSREAILPNRGDLQPENILLNFSQEVPLDFLADSALDYTPMKYIVCKIRINDLCEFSNNNTVTGLKYSDILAKIR